MTFHLPSAIDLLQRTPVVLSSLLENLAPEWTSSNEGGESWSVFDIVGHLVNGEKTDWIPRTQIILSGEVNRLFTPFDRYAQFNDSRGKTLGELLAEFQKLRSKNLSYLSSLNLSENDLTKTGIHPAFGEVSLEQLLSTWVVHDLNHIAQITRVMAVQYRHEVGPWIEYLGILKR